ncbi:sigma-70 family RNA polymerase sigma factor [Candidatus Poribacteria bacterium]|nr:sigma-70 family RNA polymerase sigma factor [Candidatus Poribacteria bacterium]
MNRIPDSELIKRSIGGDQHAFATLIKLIEMPLLKLVRSEIPDSTSAEDVFQEVLLGVWQGLKTLQDSERFYAWAMQIARNRCRDFFRSTQRREHPMAHIDLEPIVNGRRTQTGSEAKLLDTVLHALSYAPPDEAKAARLFYLEGLSIREIAEQLGRPEGTIKRWLSHARRFVRSRLGLRQMRIPRRKTMTREAYERKYYQREALRKISACREDSAASLHLQNPAGSRELPSELWTLTQLKNLSLHWNGLENLPEEIGRLKNLEMLCFVSDQLKRLPSEIVSLSRLRHLEVTDSQLGELPADFSRLSALRTIILHRNQLRELPASFGELNRLEIAELDINQLEKLPDDLSGLTNLRVLTLSYNRLSALPKAIGELPAMEELYVEANQLNELPDEIGNLENLETLAIAENQIRALPSTIGRLSKLQELCVGSNQLTGIPPEIGQLTELWELTLSKNQLTSLPKELADLPNLQVVTLHDNPLPERLIQAAEKGIDEFRRVVVEVM